MAAETDPMRKKLLNAKQLAQKVGMNSVYGLTGATRGMLPCVRIASAITAQGRAMLKRSKEYVEAHFPCEVVYGDSVAADTLLTVLEPGAPPRTLRVDRLYDELEAMREDQTLSALCILTLAGVQPVLAAVRHETTKRMFRVTLANGASVDGSPTYTLAPATTSVRTPATALSKPPFPLETDVSAFTTKLARRALKAANHSATAMMSSTRSSRAPALSTIAWNVDCCSGTVKSSSSARAGSCGSAAITADSAHIESSDVSRMRTYATAGITRNVPKSGSSRGRTHRFASLAHTPPVSRSSAGHIPLACERQHEKIAGSSGSRSSSSEGRQLLRPGCRLQARIPVWNGP